MAYHVLKYEEDLVMLPDDFLELHKCWVLELSQRQHLAQPQCFIPAVELPLHLFDSHLE